MAARNLFRAKISSHATEKNTSLKTLKGEVKSLDSLRQENTVLKPICESIFFNIPFAILSIQRFGPVPDFTSILKKYFLCISCKAL